MKIIEGKQAVLRPYRTEKECVRPHRGQNALTVEPMVCTVTELPTAGAAPRKIPDAEIHKPVEGNPRTISDAEMRKPVECNPQMISYAPVQKPIESVSQVILDAQVQEPSESVSQVVSGTEGTVSRAEVVQASIECVPQRAAGTELKEITNLNPRPLHAAEAQVIPALPEWGKILDEATSGMSGRKKRKRLAETILHMTDAQ